MPTNHLTNCCAIYGSDGSVAPNCAINGSATSCAKMPFMLRIASHLLQDRLKQSKRYKFYYWSVVTAEENKNFKNMYFATSLLTV